MMVSASRRGMPLYAGSSFQPTVDAPRRWIDALIVLIRDYPPNNDRAGLHSIVNPQRQRLPKSEVRDAYELL